MCGKPMPAGSSQSVGSCPKIKGATSAQEEIITDAHKKAEELINSVLSKCIPAAKNGNDILLKRYFGIDKTDKNYDKIVLEIEENFKKMQKDLNIINYKVVAENIEAGKPFTVAYIYKLPIFNGIGPIRLTHPAFTEIISPEKRASTIVHELSHWSNGTEDKAYQWETKWADLEAKERMDNADSFAEFANTCHNVK